MNDAPILAHLEALPKFKRGRNGWSNARCPAHDDQTASFGWKTNADGAVGLKCQADCSAEMIVAALELKMRDLWPPRTNGASGTAAPGPALLAPVATRTTYEVRDRAGTLQAYHDRIDHADGTKEFRWRGADGKSGLGGTPPTSFPLYGAELLDTWLESEPIVVVEGEKAKDALADALTDAGIHVLGTVTGASSCPGEKVLADLKDRIVVLWPDADDAGKKHMADMHEGLELIAAKIGWVKPRTDAPKGWDAADAIAEERDVKQMIAVAQDQEEHWRELQEEHRRRLGLRPLSAISTEPPPPPLLCDRLVPNGHSILFGPGGVGKGSYAAHLACELVADGHHVLILRLRGPPRTSGAERIASLGGTQAAEGITHCSPTASSWHGRSGALWEHVSDIHDAVAATGATYIIIDSIVMACGSADVMDPQTPARYSVALNQLGKPALSLAHVTKAEDARYPFGSVFWSNLARITWAMAPTRDGAALTMGKANRYKRPPRELVVADLDDRWPAGLGRDAAVLDEARGAGRDRTGRRTRDPGRTHGPTRRGPRG